VRGLGAIYYEALRDMERGPHNCATMSGSGLRARDSTVRGRTPHASQGSGSITEKRQRGRDHGLRQVEGDRGRAPDHFIEDTPTAVLVRQVLGAIAQFEKALLVAKMKVARDRKIAAGEKCGGRRSHAELRPEVVALARQLRKRRRKGRQLPCGISRPSLRPWVTSMRFNMLRMPEAAR